MQKTTAYLATEHGSKYLQQLCKHFAHKVEVEYDPHHARCAMPMGPAELKADAGGLWVEVSAADAEGMEKAKGVIDRHLEKFAFREGFTRMPWADEAA